ncbi:5-oxoprolinase subunit B family protein [Gordonia zhaorongruii]|uniref:5-oxoprolinase subunit B family protein n=1 Tax=Gordonia zhaorongruii TaxID=2597659 RepID=UPI00104A2B4C|nr:carboxyltransferase domain-containing protein [Gordonia zhaorongruii]
MRERPAGDDGLLLDFGQETDPARIASSVAKALRAAAADGRLEITDAVAGAETVLVEALPGAGLNELGVRRVVHDVLSAGHATPPAETFTGTAVDVPVTYDGADLTSAAEGVGHSPARLITAHSAITWQVQFMGFAPGFGYLVPHPASDPDDVAVLASLGRRDESRTAVPPGSVAVAAGYSAIYPRDSPGGWHLIGRTSLSMWDSDAEPPALLAAGDLVRFTAAGTDSR